MGGATLQAASRGAGQEGGGVCGPKLDAERVGKNGSSGRLIAWEQLFRALGAKKRKKREWAGLCSSMVETSRCL